MRRLLFAILVALASQLAPARAEAVDVALLLAIDISASVDAEEYRLQMTGLAAALKSDAVLEAIKSGPEKRIAIALMQWSGTRTQSVVIPWTVISTEDEAARLGVTVLQTKRADPGGGTSISAALVQASRYFADAPSSYRKVIDVSSDGINNIGPPLIEARLHAIDKGITINGLAIANDWPKLQEYLELEIIGGPNAFAVTAKSYDDFGAAMLKKLVREITAPGSS